MFDNLLDMLGVDMFAYYFAPIFHQQLHGHDHFYDNCKLYLFLFDMEAF